MFAPEKDCAFDIIFILISIVGLLISTLVTSIALII